jgi:GNAT superfamily N-acetyltransferase
MELVELTNPEQASNVELRERAKHIGANGYTKNFLVFEEGREVAFVSLDFWPKGYPLILHDLLVSTDVRRNLVGTRVLNAVEVIAKQNNYPAVSLQPKSFNSSLPNKRLISWYKRCGYTQVSNNGRITLSKSLVPNLEGGVST